MEVNTLGGQRAVEDGNVNASGLTHWGATRCRRWKGQRIRVSTLGGQRVPAQLTITHHRSCAKVLRSKPRGADSLITTDCH